jgi:hypothetical protein
MDDGKIEYEEAPARREDQPALPIAVARSCSKDPHAKIFGLSLAVVLAACLVQNAASPSTARAHGLTGKVECNPNLISWARLCRRSPPGLCSR